MWAVTKNKNIDYYLCLVILIPIVLFIANQQWLFPFGNASDNWINDSYFFDYGKNLSLFDSYKVVRLSWLLKGWLVHKLFPPLAAYYLLNTIIFYACIIPFYYINKILFNRYIALLATLAFATYSQFHSINSFEWDYHTHDATANLLLSLLFLLLATKRPHWKLYLFLAGTTCASAFQSPFILIHGISIIFWYCFLNRKDAKHPLFTSALMFALGGIVMTAIYCTINYLAGGPFLYFLPDIPGQFGWPDGLATYAYQPSYWQSFGTMLLHNKGIIVPFFSLLLSIAGYFYLVKKKPEHLHKSSVLLCFIAFWLCLPIPIIFQALGWSVLSLYHWNLGMVQFVFLALAGVFSVFLPKMEHPEKIGRYLIGYAFAIFCGVLVFGLDLQTLFNHWLVFNPARTAQLFLLLLMVTLLWKYKQIKQYLPLVLALSLVVLFREHLHGRLKLDVLILLGLLFLLWKNRGLEPSWLNKVTFFISLTIFPLLSVSSSYFAIPYLPMLQTLVICAFLFIPMAYICLYWKEIRKYSAILYLSVLFAVANLFSASIPVAFYTVNFKCGYFKDQYLAVMKGTKILRQYDPTYHMYVWFRNNERVPYPNASCRSQNLAGIYGFPVIGMTAMYAAIWGARYKLLFLPEKGNAGLLNASLNTLPKGKHWEKFAPKMAQDSPNRKLFEFLSDTFGGYLGSDSFSNFKAEKFWLHVFPSHFKLAILGHTLKEDQMAVKSLEKYGRYMADKRIYKVKEGVVSYYIVMGVVRNAETTHR